MAEELRSILERLDLACFVVPSEDPHDSEYPAEHFKRRAWISGFNGSAGTAILQRKGPHLLFVDPRYWIKAEEVASASGWTVVRTGDLDAMTPNRWLAEKLSAGSRIGVDPQQYSVASMSALVQALKGSNNELVYLDNLVDRVWVDRPNFPDTGCWVHPEKYAGRSVSSKLEALREEMKKKQCHVLLVSALDQVMWMLNLRGADSLESPVMYSYLLVTPDKAFFYAWNRLRVPVDAAAALTASGVEILEYEQVMRDLTLWSKALSPGTKVWVDNKSLNFALWNCLSGKDGEVLTSSLPIGLWKAVKNEAERNGMRECHVLDAVAKTRFLAWIEEQVMVKHNMDLTEPVAAQCLLAFRAEEKGFVTYSFDTIMGYAANGADIHYHPKEDPATKIGPGMLLIDSGGHYLSGTTDVTRTIHLGSPSEHEKRCYTRVLQGHVDLARAVFPRKVKAFQLDICARLPLYRDGLDYLHGTGHGVGAFLNVHEYPVLISSGVSEHSDVILDEGMIFSDEPGYYEKGNFGVRIESLLLCTKAKTLHQFHHPHYLSLENLTVIPFCRRLIEPSLLSAEQIQYIDEFHATCRAKLAPLLQQRKDTRALQFLMRETEPLGVGVAAVDRGANAPSNNSATNLSSFLIVAVAASALIAAALFRGTK